MTVTVTTRAGKGSPLTHEELDANFNDLALQVNTNASDNTEDHGTLAQGVADLVEDLALVVEDLDTAEETIVDHGERLTPIEEHVAATSGNPHLVTQTDVGLTNVTNDAQMKRADGDILTFDEETTPVMEDVVLIEKADGTKKRIQLGNIPSTGASSEADIYQDVLGDSKYQHATYDDFNDEELVDGTNTDATYSQNDTRYDFTVGEIVQSDDLYDSDAGLSEITECMVLAIYTDSGTPTIEATADGGTNWETITLNTVHTFTDTGTDLRLRFTAGGTGHLDSWAVFYNPDETAVVEPVDWLKWNNSYPEQFASSPNLLINPQFTINQRGYAGGALGAAAYGYDRWRANGAGVSSLTLSGDTLTITADGLVQLVESGTLVEGQEYTVSWLGTSQVYDFDASAYTSGVQSLTFTYTAATWGSNALIIFGAGTLQQPMLVAGPYAAPFQARPIAQELALCQRYYERLTLATFAGYCISALIAYIPILYQVPKQSTPTVTASLTSSSVIHTPSSGAISVSSVSTAAGGNGAILQVIVASGLTAGYGTWLRILSTDYVEVDAEL